MKKIIVFMLMVLMLTSSVFAADFYESNGTIFCENASVGDTGIVNGVNYTKRTNSQITTSNANTTCTSGITTMSYMFNNEGSFNQDIGNWDTSSVTDMIAMFSYSNFNQDINNWDVSSVTNMGIMFWGSSSFNQDLSDWVTIKVTNMDFMFEDSNFNQDISGWCVPLISSEPTDFSLGAPLISGNKPVWGTCPQPNNFTEIDGTVYCDSYEVGDEGLVDGVMYTKRSVNQITTSNANTTCTSGITDVHSLFYNDAFNQDISTWDVSSVTNMDALFDSSTFNQDISNWDVSSVTDMDYMFYDTPFNQPLNDWNVSSVTRMEATFEGSSFNQDISGWCVTLITSEPDYFAEGGCPLTEANKPVWGTCPQPVVEEPVVEMATSSTTSAARRGDYYYQDADGNIYSKDQIEGTATPEPKTTFSITNIPGISNPFSGLWDNISGWFNNLRWN